MYTTATLLLVKIIEKSRRMSSRKIKETPGHVAPGSHVVSNGLTTPFNASKNRVARKTASTTVAAAQAGCPIRSAARWSYETRARLPKW